MVAMGLGITFLPALYVRTVIARGTSIKTLEIEDRAVYRTVGLIWRRSSARQASYKSLASLLRKLIDREFEELTVLT
jgi:LysR family hydrogen peroxide-inducible transcriptional activator